jgi:hypothetical protein
MALATAHGFRRPPLQSGHGAALIGAWSGASCLPAGRSCRDHRGQGKAAAGLRQRRPILRTSTPEWS